MPPRAVANVNFAVLGGHSPHECDAPRYREYRRRWHDQPATFSAGNFPIHLDLEASSRCNLRCTFCDKLPLLSPDRLGDMNFNLFSRIIGEGRENSLASLKLSYRGEPLLNPRLADMVDLAKRSGVLDVYFNTNAMLLTEAKSRALIEAGLDRISVSVEGTDPDAFERQRVGARFDTIMRRLDALLSLRNALGVSHPQVRVQTVRLPGLDLDDYARFWLEHADEVAVVDFKTPAARRTGQVAENFACPQLWQRLTVEFDGTVCGCNNDDLHLLNLGNAGHHPIRECWLDPALANARELHRLGRSHEVPACDGCPWRSAQLDKKTDARPKF